ncbi:MAG: heavy metal-binding domain-containing protein [Bacilli bacterium]|nr:heavy metal-binding domain-containing protein [Bacilli bacterium]
MNNILITTGDIQEEYEVIDTIFAVDSCKESFFNGADPNKAFNKVKETLRSKANELGGQAVINCQFEYRNATAPGFVGSKQVIEIFAYGTAVRLH